MMSAGENVCKVPAKTPWKNYDLFDEVGVRNSNGQIDPADLKAWVSQYELPVSYEPRVEIPKDQPQVFCGLFRLAMIREQFINRFVRPEQTRTQALSEAEKDKIRGELQKAQRATVDAIYQEANAVQKENYGFFGCFLDDDTCKTELDLLDHFTISRAIEVVVAAREVFWSLEHEEGELYGVGIDFAMKPQLWIEDLAPTDSFVEMSLRHLGLEKGMSVWAIDGKDTTKMTFEEALVALRGPKGTEVSLSVTRFGDTQPKTVKVKRLFTPQALR